MRIRKTSKDGYEVLISYPAFYASNNGTMYLFIKNKEEVSVVWILEGIHLTAAYNHISDLMIDECFIEGRPSTAEEFTAAYNLAMEHIKHSLPLEAGGDARGVTFETSEPVDFLKVKN